jgi:hypothetical protein
MLMGRVTTCMLFCGGGPQVNTTATGGGTCTSGGHALYCTMI